MMPSTILGVRLPAAGATESATASPPPNIAANPNPPPPTAAATSAACASFPIPLVWLFVVTLYVLPNGIIGGGCMRPCDAWDNAAPSTANFCAKTFARPQDAMSLGLAFVSGKGVALVAGESAMIVTGGQRKHGRYAELTARLHDGDAITGVHPGENHRRFALAALEQVLLEGQQRVLGETLVVSDALLRDGPELGRQQLLQVNSHENVPLLCSVSLDRCEFTCGRVVAKPDAQLTRQLALQRTDAIFDASEHDGGVLRRQNRLAEFAFHPIDPLA